METGRIENPLALGFKQVQKWLEKWTPDPSLWLKLAAQISDGTAVVFAAGPTKAEVDGLLILGLPGSGISDRAQVIGAPHNGSQGVRNALIGALLAFCREKGYDSVVSINETGHADEVWLRGFGKDIPHKRIASVYEFDMRTRDVQGHELPLRRRREQVAVDVEPNRHEPVQGPAGGVRSETARTLHERWRPGVQRPVRRGDDGRRRASPPGL